MLDLGEYLDKLAMVLETRRSLVIVARTDATNKADLLRRVEAMSATDADVILADGMKDLALIHELKAAAHGKPLLFNQIAGGKSPPASIDELAAAGVAVVIYSTPCLFPAHQAIEHALEESLKARGGRLKTGAEVGPSFIGVPETTAFLSGNMSGRGVRDDASGMQGRRHAGRRDAKAFAGPPSNDDARKRNGPKVAGYWESPALSLLAALPAFRADRQYASRHEDCQCEASRSLAASLSAGHGSSGSRNPIRVREALHRVSEGTSGASCHNTFADLVRRRQRPQGPSPPIRSMLRASVSDANRRLRRTIGRLPRRPPDFDSTGGSTCGRGAADDCDFGVRLPGLLDGSGSLSFSSFNVGFGVAEPTTFDTFEFRLNRAVFAIRPPHSRSLA